MQESVLKNLLVKQTEPTLDAAAVLLTDRMPEPKDSDLPTLEAALESAFKTRPDLLQAEGNLQNQEIANRFTQSSLKPSMAVFGMYAGAGLQGDRAEGQTSAADSLWQAFEGEFPQYGGGVSLSIPLRNRVAQADNLRSQLEGKQLRLGLQRSRNQAALEVRKAVIGLIQGRAQLEAARETVRLATEIWRGEQERLEAGVSTSYQVILRERDLVAAQQAEVTAGVGYAKALVEMDRAMGATLDRRRIQVEDALSGAVRQAPVPSFTLGLPVKRSE
jgi:outer membrane protein TolC